MSWHNRAQTIPPAACHVLAAYFDINGGEWVCDVQATWEMRPEFTHWKMLDTPEDDKTTITTGWIPEADPHMVAAVGKLGEELCEAALVCFRMLIQGVGASDPKTMVPNITALEKELTDVRATSKFVGNYLPISDRPERYHDKISGYHNWHNLIDEHLKAKREAYLPMDGGMVDDPDKR